MECKYALATYQQMQDERGRNTTDGGYYKLSCPYYENICGKGKESCPKEDNKAKED